MKTQEAESVKDKGSALIVINQKCNAQGYCLRGSVFNYSIHSKSNCPILPSSPPGEYSRYPRRPPIHIAIPEYVTSNIIQTHTIDLFKLLLFVPFIM